MTTANEISAHEIEESGRAAWERDFERDYSDYFSSRGTSSDPLTDQDLWRYEGQFECLGHEPELTVRDGRELRAIVFILKRAA